LIIFKSSEQHFQFVFIIHLLQNDMALFSTSIGNSSLPATVVRRFSEQAEKKS
jgi:hypothetical protein